MHFEINSGYGKITTFQMFPEFELYMKIKIEVNAESPVILMVKAQGHEKIDDLVIHACWDHLKPNYESKQQNYINLEN